MVSFLQNKTIQLVNYETFPPVREQNPPQTREDLFLSEQLEPKKRRRLSEGARKSAKEICDIPADE
jgi:hypothetical protein